MLDRIGDWIGTGMLVAVATVCFGIAAMQVALVVVFLHWVWLAW